MWVASAAGRVMVASPSRMPNSRLRSLSVVVVADHRPGRSATVAASCCGLGSSGRVLAREGGLRLGQLGQLVLSELVRPLRIGEDLDDAAGFVLALPESRRMLASAPEETMAADATALREAFGPFAGPNGVVMDGAAWLVTARR